MALELRKCQAPVPGFSGTVALRRRRRWSDVADQLPTVNR